MTLRYIAGLNRVNMTVVPEILHDRCRLQMQNMQFGNGEYIDNIKLLDGDAHALSKYHEVEDYEIRYVEDDV